MQHIYEKSSTIPQHDAEYYGSSSYNAHYGHPNEMQSVSPQQSSTSDIEEISTSTNHHHHRTDSSTSKILKKKKQSKKKRKDPNEPQKPVSPYALFFRDTQNDIKKKLINPSFGEISKVVAHMWENIEPELKEQYKHRAAAAKKEYLKQLAAYRAVQVSHQIPTMSHILNQAALPFNANMTQQTSKAYPGTAMMPDHCSHSHHQPFSSSSSSQGHIHQRSHYLNHSYSHESQMFFQNHSQSMYSPYDTNNNSSYGLIRSNADFEHYPSYYPATSYGDLNSGNMAMSSNDEKSYQYHPPLNENNRNQLFLPTTTSAAHQEPDAHWNSNSQW